MPDDRDAEDRNALRKCIEARLGRIIRRCRQMIAVAESLASNRPDIQPPMDCEPERVMLATALRMRAINNPADPEYRRLSDQMVRHAVEVAKSES